MLNIPVRVRHLIKRTCSTDPYAIAKELNCTVLVLPLPSRVNGMWRRILRRKYIFVNDSLCEWQQEAVICHELGHIILHKGYHAYSMHGASYSCARKENEANLFAELLMREHFPVDDCHFVRAFLDHASRRMT